MKYMCVVSNPVYDEESIERHEVYIERENKGLRVLVGKRAFNVDLVEISNKRFSLLLDNSQYEFELFEENDGRRILLNGVPYFVKVEEKEQSVDEFTDNKSSLHLSVQPNKEIFKAPMPGLVVVVKVERGIRVKRGDALLILEAMKMQNELRSPHDGVVTEVFVKEGSPVEKGEKLVELEKS